MYLSPKKAGEYISSSAKRFRTLTSLQYFFKMKRTPLILALLLSGALFGQKLVVLGTLQDAGSPQLLCEKECCAHPKVNDYVACLGVADSTRALLFDATPDIVPQLTELLARSATDRYSVFLTHAHIGHYTGLMHFDVKPQTRRRYPSMRWTE